MKPALIAMLLATACAGFGQQPPLPLARFHHLHLNTTNPQAAIEFYTKHFDSEKGKFGELINAVWTQKSWLLFNKVSRPSGFSLKDVVVRGVDLDQRAFTC